MGSNSLVDANPRASPRASPRAFRLGKSRQVVPGVHVMQSINWTIIPSGNAIDIREPDIGDLKQPQTSEVLSIAQCGSFHRDTSLCCATCHLPCHSATYFASFHTWLSPSYLQWLVLGALQKRLYRIWQQSGSWRGELRRLWFNFSSLRWGRHRITTD
jgi:hypothetical protein